MRVAVGVLFAIKLYNFYYITCDLHRGRGQAVAAWRGRGLVKPTFMATNEPQEYT